MSFSVRSLAAGLALALGAASAAIAAGPLSVPRYQSTGFRPASASFSRLQPAPPTSDAPEREPETVTPVPDNSLNHFGESDSVFDEGEFGDGGCCDGCCPTGGMLGGMWYSSLDYLLVRPRLSQGIALYEEAQINNAGANTASDIARSTQFPFDYQSAFRVSLGRRLLACGGDIQLTYWRMTGDASVTRGPSNIENQREIITGALGISTNTDGQFLTASTGIAVNIFDLDFAKTISMGGPSQPCDACFCPRWSLRWAAGARVADISRFNNNQVANADGSLARQGAVDARFVGAGPRVGVLGTRYFGQNGCFSLYAKASQALLIGDYRMSRNTARFVGGETTTLTSLSDNISRVVPVTDIELGGTWQIAPFTFVSVGYFFQCWWDLGQSESVAPPFGTPLDTANILGFDGLFVRGELLF